MAYYSRHSIFLPNNDKQKLQFIQSLLDEDGLSFVLQEETVYQHDGEPLIAPCISDANWNSGSGYVWYDFEHDMERISEEFFQKYPDDTINVYVKTENGFENLYEFFDGGVHDTEVIHYQIELNKVCEELNQRTSIDRLPLFEVIDIAQHPTILYHYGAYTFIGYNVFELYGDFSQHFELAISYGDSGRNYNNLLDRIKAQQILYDNLLERRKAESLRL